MGADILVEQRYSTAQSAAQRRPALIVYYVRLSQDGAKLVGDISQSRNIQPSEILYQLDLLVMSASKRFTIGFTVGADGVCEPVIPQGSAAVENWSKTDPFKGFRVPHSAEIIIMPILIYNYKIKRQHTIDALNNAGYPQFAAAVNEMLIWGCTVI